MARNRSEKLLGRQQDYVALLQEIVDHIAVCERCTETCLFSVSCDAARPFGPLIDAVRGNALGFNIPTSLLYGKSWPETLHKARERIKGYCGT